ncbi:MAG: flagellar hook-length control protein FliK [Succinivibrio sp.]|nr:flagellar hook-length control protein FliK [Succinivibrio sp.]
MDSFDVNIKEADKSAPSKKADSTADSSNRQAQPRINASATVSYLSVLSREQGLLSEGLSRSLNNLQSTLNEYIKNPEALKNISPDQAEEAQGQYKKLSAQVINRDPSLQEKVAQNLSTGKKLVRSRDAAQALSSSLDNLPPPLKEGTSAGKALSKFICESLVNLTDHGTMGAGLERDLAVRNVYVPNTPLSTKSKLATDRSLQTSIAYIESNQPEVLAKLKETAPVKEAPGSTTPQIMTRYLRQALNEFPDDSTYLDIFKHNRGNSLEEPYEDKISKETAQRIHSLIAKAADTARRGNLIPGSRTVPQESSAETVPADPALKVQGEKTVSASENVRELSLSELSARAARLQQQFREERQKLAAEGKVPNAAAAPQPSAAAASAQTADAPKIDIESISARASEAAPAGQESLAKTECETIKDPAAQQNAQVKTPVNEAAADPLRSFKNDGVPLAAKFLSTQNPAVLESDSAQQPVKTQPETSLVKDSTKTPEDKSLKAASAEVPENKVSDKAVPPAPAEAGKTPAAETLQSNNPQSVKTPVDTAQPQSSPAAYLKGTVSLPEFSSVKISYTAIQSSFDGGLGSVPGMTLPVEDFNVQKFADSSQVKDLAVPKTLNQVIQEQQRLSSELKEPISGQNPQASAAAQSSGSTAASSNTATIQDAAVSTQKEQPAASVAKDTPLNVPKEQSAAAAPKEAAVNVPKEQSAAPAPKEATVNVPKEQSAAPAPKEPSVNVPKEQSAAPVPKEPSVNVPKEQSAAPAPKEPSVNVPKEQSAAAMPKDAEAAVVKDQSPAPGSAREASAAANTIKQAALSSIPTDNSDINVLKGQTAENTAAKEDAAGQNPSADKAKILNTDKPQTVSTEPKDPAASGAPIEKQAGGESEAALSEKVSELRSHHPRKPSANMARAKLLAQIAAAKEQSDIQKNQNAEQESKISAPEKDSIIYQKKDILAHSMQEMPKSPAESQPQAEKVAVEASIPPTPAETITEETPAVQTADNNQSVSNATPQVNSAEQAQAAANTQIRTEAEPQPQQQPQMQNTVITDDSSQKNDASYQKATLSVADKAYAESEIARAEQQNANIQKQTAEADKAAAAVKTAADPKTASTQGAGQTTEPAAGMNATEPQNAPSKTAAQAPEMAAGQDESADGLTARRNQRDAEIKAQLASQATEIADSLKNSGASEAVQNNPASAEAAAKDNAETAVADDRDNVDFSALMAKELGMLSGNTGAAAQTESAVSAPASQSENTQAQAQQNAQDSQLQKLYAGVNTERTESGTAQKDAGNSIMSQTVPLSELDDSDAPADIKKADPAVQNKAAPEAQAAENSAQPVQTSTGTEAAPKSAEDSIEEEPAADKPTARNLSAPGAAAITSGQSAPIPEQSVVSEVQPKEGGFFKRIASLFGRHQSHAAEAAQAENSATAQHINAAIQAQQNLVSARANPLDQMMYALRVQTQRPDVPNEIREQAEKLIKNLNNPVADLQTVSSWLNFVTGPISPSSPQALALHQWAFFILCLRYGQIGKDINKLLKNTEDGQEVEKNLRALNKKLGSKDKTVSSLVEETFNQIERFQQLSSRVAFGEGRYIPLPPNYEGGREGSMSARREKDEDGNDAWHLNFTFDLHDLGPIEIKAVAKLPEINISVVAESVKALQKVQENMPVLQKQLQDQGITTRTTSARLGKIALPEPQAEQSRKNHDGNFSVDA